MYGYISVAKCFSKHHSKKFCKGAAVCCSFHTSLLLSALLIYSASSQQEVLWMEYASLVSVSDMPPTHHDGIAHAGIDSLLTYIQRNLNASVILGLPARKRKELITFSIFKVVKVGDVQVNWGTSYGALILPFVTFCARFTTVLHLALPRTMYYVLVYAIEQFLQGYTKKKQLFSQDFNFSPIIICYTSYAVQFYTQIAQKHIQQRPGLTNFQQVLSFSKKCTFLTSICFSMVALYLFMITTLSYFCFRQQLSSSSNSLVMLPIASLFLTHFPQ